MEIWKKIDGYDNYSVSTEGRMRNDKTGRILKVRRRGNEYLGVTLCKNGKTKVFYVHRLVAQAFIPNPNNLPCIDHIDTKRDNNRVENLKWCSQKDNCNNPLTLEKRSRAVIAINIENPTITIEYSPMSQAQKEGFKTSSICECCNGERKTHKGYYWCYKEEYIKFLESLKTIIR